MKLERKFIPIATVKADAEQYPTGAVEGYAAVYGNVDEGGDIIVGPKPCSNLKEFLQSGFTAEGHQWGFDGVVGFPVEAAEDENGLFAVSVFHGTEDAQQIRQIVQERIAAGKTVGLSIGFRIDEEPIWIKPDGYATELPKYLAPKHLAEGLKKAKRFPYGIRIITKYSLFEYSIVTSPMNRRAAVTGVKSLAASASLTEHSEAVASTLDEFTLSAQETAAEVKELLTRAQTRADVRAKAGRVISKPNMDLLKACRESMGASCEALDALIAMGEKPDAGKSTLELRLRLAQLTGV